MAIDYAALKTELQADPNSYGYAAPLAAGNQRQLADMLNEARASIQIGRGVVDAHEVFGKFDPAEFNSLTAEKRSDAWGVLGMGAIDANHATTAAIFAEIFSGKTVTLAALNDYRTRDGSRAEELFGADTSVTFQDIGKALES